MSEGKSYDFRVRGNTDRIYPAIADGNVLIYKQFMNGALVYKPNSKDDVGKLTFPFRDWVNPETLRGTCDLSTCGDAGKYLIINSGYRTQKSGQSKVEVFITPRFLVEKEMGKTLGHYRAHDQKWTSEVGILFSWGHWRDNSWGEYQTKDNFELISSQSLHQIFVKSHAHIHLVPGPRNDFPDDNTHAGAFYMATRVFLFDF